MSNETAVKRSTVQETGSFLAQGLPFVDGDVEKALDITVSKFSGNTVTLSPARAAVEAVSGDEERGIAAVEAKPAVEAVEIVIGPETRQELLGAIASLPQLRGMFTETVANLLADAREGDAEYAKLLESYQDYAEKLAAAEQAILAFDEANAPGFDIQTLVKWSPTEEPEPRTFVVGGTRSGGTRTRARSTVRWALQEYIPTQRDVEGPEAAYHGIRLIKLGDGTWSVEADEGRVVVASSPNKAMREMLVSAGLSPQRSANDFWNGSEQEKEAGIS